MAAIIRKFLAGYEYIFEHLVGEYVILSLNQQIKFKNKRYYKIYKKEAIV